MPEPAKPNRLSIGYQGPATGRGYEEWREEVCRSFCRLDVAPAVSNQIDCRNEFAIVDSVSLATPIGSSARFARTRDLLDDDCTDFVLISVGQGQVSVKQGAKAVDLSTSQVCLTEMNVCGDVGLTQSGAFRTLRMPRSSLLRVAPKAEAQLAKALHGSAALITMLDQYFSLCNDVAQKLDAVGQRIAAEHLVDLVGLLLTCSDDRGNLAEQSGYSAVRLELMKKSILENLCNWNLSIDSVAKWTGLSARQAQRAFAQSGTTYTDFVLEQRLLHARKLLSHSHNRHRKISDIAYASGFGDLSYFNRAFRKRFGATPTDLHSDEESR